jgi:L-asparagine transporter-like permease
LARVIVEEMFMGLAVYFLTFLLIIFVASQFYRELTISLSVIVVAPLITAVISFCFFVYMRKITGKDYQIKRGSAHYRVNMAIFVICCFFLVILGVRNIADENSLFGLMWVCFGIFCGAWGIREVTKKSDAKI